MQPLTFGQKILVYFYKVLNFFIAWHLLPSLLGMGNILAHREEYRSKNLQDTYPTEEYQGTEETDPMPDTKYLSVRHSDGKFNSIEQPRMGCAGMRFGRNFAREHTKKPSFDEMMTPNPRLVSETLMARNEGFKPATIVNLLAAAWIQFQVHDWANHENTTDAYDVPLPKGNTWSARKLQILKTKADEPLDVQDLKCPAYKNTSTPWWDGSQIYGSSEERTEELRTSAAKNDGKLQVDSINGEGFLPRTNSLVPDTGFSDNWWLGLELLHTLFAMEHNAIATQLKLTNPHFSGDEIFDTARLIICALMAKIHSVEWTPGILNHPALERAMNGSWWGLLGERLWKAFGQVSKEDWVSGIPGSDTDQTGCPYSITEEFVSVYRLHPLIPDDVAFFSVKDGVHQTTIPIKELAFGYARKPFESGKLSWADVLYSFGINYPGAITHNNTPDFLRDLHIPDGRHYDMSTVDILRDRERGIPRYNEFRRLFHMSPKKSFLDLTGGNHDLAEKLSEVYNGNIELVDLLIGCHCEPLPKGFGFSDTAFRVFILMANRRVKSDRFLTTDFTPDIYTHEGIAWVQNNTMKDVLCRHYPELRAPLRDVKNAFAPWHKVGRSAEYKGKETNEHPEPAAAQVNGHR